MNWNILVTLGVVLAVLSPLGLTRDGLAKGNKGADNARISQKTREANAKDREMTRKVRRELATDPTLSTYGKNVKVVTLNGQVTLKGPVRSQVEMERVFSLASLIAGEARVKNQLRIKRN